MSRRWMLLLALALTCCGSRDERQSPSAAPAIAAPTEPVPVPEPATEATPMGTPAPSTTEPLTTPLAPRLDPEQRRALVALVREARGRARRDDWETALTTFEHALALDPSSARLRCETGYAAYRAGRLEDADRLIGQAERALPPDPGRTPPTLRVPTAMCLYNAALVHQARGRIDEAREALTASVALRPNATAQGALDALGGAADALPEVVVLDGLDDAAVDARVLDAMCAAAELESCESVEDQWPTIERSTVEPAHGEGAPFAARLVTIDVEDAGEGARGSDEHHEWLVVREGARALAGPVRADYATMTMDCGSADTRFEWIDLVPGGTRELLVDATSCVVEQSGCGAGGSDGRTIVACAAAPLRCIAIPVRESYDYDEYGECDGMYEGDSTSESHGYALDVEIGATALTLRPTRGAPPPATPIGVNAWADLLARDALRWGR